MTNKCTPAFTLANLIPQLFLVTVIAFTAPALFAQSDNSGEAAVSAPDNKAKPLDFAPVLSDLRGVSIGMTADQVKEKLGKADSSDASGMYYTFENGESMQLALDGKETVTTIAEIYSGKDSKAPELKEVFGPDSSAQPAADGKVYKMIRYPNAGFWITYSRLNLDAGPLTTITIKKMN
jgi:hypothetical protein